MTARIELPDKFAGRKGVRVRQSTGITASSSRDGFICANDSPLTHAEMDENFNSTWPIGSIYINVSSSENPKKLIGFGTWESFGRRQIMVGVNNSPAGVEPAENSPAGEGVRFRNQRARLATSQGERDTMFSKQIEKMSIFRNVAFIKFHTPHKFCVGQKLTIAGIEEHRVNSSHTTSQANVDTLSRNNWIGRDRFANSDNNELAPNLNRGDCEIIGLGRRFSFGQDSSLGVYNDVELNQSYANDDYCVTILFGLEKNNIRNNLLNIDLPGSGGRGVDDLIEYLENQAVEEGEPNVAPVHLHKITAVLTRATATLFGTLYGGPYRSHGQPFIDILRSSPTGFNQPVIAGADAMFNRVNSPGNAIRYQDYLNSWYYPGGGVLGRAETHYGGSPTRFSPSMSYPNFTVGEGGKDSIYLREYQLPRHEHSINWEICKIRKVPTEGIMFPLPAGQNHGDGKRRKTRNGWGYNSGAIIPRPVGISQLRKNAYNPGNQTGRHITNGYTNSDGAPSVNFDTHRKLDRRGNRLVLVNTSLNLGPYGAGEDLLKYGHLYEGHTFDGAYPIEHEVRSSRRHFDERIETYKNSLGQRVFHDEPGGTQSADGSGDRTFGPTSYPMGLPHSNLMPFITAYFWRRIA